MSHLEPSSTALLIIDPQNDLLSEGGMWDVVGDAAANISKALWWPKGSRAAERKASEIALECRMLPR